jgi:hypothetical protein
MAIDDGVLSGASMGSALGPVARTQMPLPTVNQQRSLSSAVPGVIAVGDTAYRIVADIAHQAIDRAGGASVSSIAFDIVSAMSLTLLASSTMEACAAGRQSSTNRACSTDRVRTQA